MKKIIDEEQLIALIVQATDWQPGLSFLTQQTDNLQIATWIYDKGKHIKAHGHKKAQRVVDHTQEVLFIKTGKLKAYFYNKEDKIINSQMLKTSDIVVIFSGGHSYDVLENGTAVLEVKNGPYPGMEKDKKVIEK